MGVLGVLFILFGVTMTLFVGLSSEKVKSKQPKFIKNWGLNKGLVTVVVGLGLIIFNMSIFYSEAGYQYFIVKPSGEKTAVMTEGYHFITPLSKIQPWQKYIDVKVVGEEMGEEDINEIEGKMSPIDLRFIDQVTATGIVSTRFQLPQDAKSFIDIAIKFRSMSNLVNNTLIPTVREQMINTGYMYAAQNYISGDAQSFRQTFEEQLKGGAFAVNKREIKDTIYSPIKVDGDRTIREIKTRYLVSKKLHNGIPKRIPHEITDNNIIVSQVIVDKVNLHKAFKKRLEKQRDESAKRQLEQQKIETAKSTKQRIMAEGERDKAQERVTQEKEQVKKLIAIETEKKQEETKLELAEIALKTKKLEADALKVQADAESYKNSRLVRAGLTPQEKMKRDIEMINVATRNMAGPDGIKLPQFYQNGGSGNDNSDPLSKIMQMMMGQQLINKK